MKDYQELVNMTIKSLLITKQKINGLLVDSVTLPNNWKGNRSNTDFENWLKKRVKHKYSYVVNRK